ncbi:MAG: hypothetical protein FRX49_07595 [Trebouxia sp. A1-2]|nr:MAG: hypothetical protein FRX49_07595 [Trebouxia sp. A1-2]
MSTEGPGVTCRAAAAAISQRAAGWVGPSVPSLVKHVLDRIGQEEHQSNQEELAGRRHCYADGLLKALAVAAVAYNAGHEGQQKEDDWFGKLLTEPLLRAAASGPSKQRVASGCTMVHAVLTAVLEWANYPPVISASVDCLRTTLSYLNTGLLVPRVPEVFLPLKQCIEILGANLQPRSAQAILDQCLQGIMQKEDWQMRRQAVETFITLAAAVQVHKPSEGGQWHLEHTPCIEVLVKNKTAILNALTDAKYDKITHVRQAVGKALVEMDCIPSPKPGPRHAAALSGEDSDLESVLANKKAKSNSRPWSGASTETGGSGRSALRHGGDALEEDVDERVSAPSPRSDMGAALEPEQDDGDSPKGAPTQGRATQPLRDSLQTKQGSRRHWAGNASASLNRSSAGGKGQLQDAPEPWLGKTATPAGSSVKQRKENLTPARPRHSFVKPKKQVFAPLPRAISPEREVPKPSIPDEARLFEYKAGAQEDNSPVGPLKVQLPDLTRDSDQDRVTVLTESQPHGHSEQLLLASAESSEEYDQQAGASAVPTTGSKEHTQEAEGVAKSGKAAELSAHTGRHEANERAETKPDVHVDKPAGIISITRLPPGSSIRLVGLQHSLYEHPVKVEILAPSARGMDHFSYSLAGFSQGVLQNLGLGLQSSAMHMVQMQQQQQQQASRLPAWAQQALMPQPHHQQQQLSPAFSPHADLPSANPSHMSQGLPPNGLFGQFADGPHFACAGGVDAHDQFGPGHTASLKASQGVGGWQPPQPQQQASANGRTPWLNPHLQHPGSNNSMHMVSGPYQQEEGVYQMYEGQTLQQHPSSAGSRPPQWQDDAWHPEASGGLEAVMRPPGSVQGSAQGDVGMAPVLSGASSGFSSPLRESGHLESLLEGRGSSGWPANDASHDSVSRQSQGDTPSQAKRGPQESQSQRAKPRGLPSTVQSTVDRIAANTGPSAAVSAEISSESSSAMFAHAEATEEEEQVAAVCYEAGSGPTSPDTALVGTVAQGNSTGSLTRCPRGQGKPPLSPVRQSLQDLVLSHDSSPSEHALVPVSIAPVMGMPKQDMNVHCNPLFTDPLAGQPDAHDSPAQKRVVDRPDLSHSEQHQQHQNNATVSASAGNLQVAGQGAVPTSPPSQLQMSLRAIMQQHAEELEDS